MTAHPTIRKPAQRKALGLAAAGVLLAAPLMLLAALPMARAAGAPDPIEPGYWDVTSHVSPIGGSKHEKRCLRHEQIARFMRGEPNKHTACNYTSQKMGDGRLDLRGTCRDKSGVGGPVHTQGTYTRTTLHVVANATLFGLPVTASLDAHRIADTCPPGAKS